MSAGLGAEEQVRLEALLTKLIGGLYGAIDFWTIVCLGQLPPDPHRFVLKQCERLEELLADIRLIVEKNLPDANTSNHQLLDKLQVTCKDLRDIFLVLAQFRTKPAEEVRLATETLKAVYENFRRNVRELCESNGVSVPFLRNWTPKQEEYFQRILEGLFIQFCNHRDSAAAPVCAPTNSL